MDAIPGAGHPARVGDTAFSKLLLFAAPPTAVMTEIGVLLLFAAGFGALAAVRFRVE